MSVTHVVGIDPGLVHTGVVRMIFDSDKKDIQIQSYAIAGADADATKMWVRGRPAFGEPTVFIEKYQPRSHLNTDAEMGKLLVELKQVLPNSQVILNTGVKKVVRKHLMELLNVWSFSTVTHHQDLRSAARIALFGMLKDEQMNRLLADIVLAKLKGRPWDVRS